jgi:hypothetical protein
VGCISRWKSVLTTVGQWPRSPGNGTLLAGGALPLANDGIGGWTGTMLLLTAKTKKQDKLFT